MNEYFKKIKGYLTVIVLSCFITGSITYLLCTNHYKRADALRTEQYRAIEQSTTDNNQQLRTELQQYKQFNSEARAILNSQGDSISKLRKIIEALPDND